MKKTLILFFFSFLAMAIEEPKYEVIEAWGDFEIRRYEPMVLAQTEVEADFSASGNQGFKKVAAFIFGENQGKEKIAMTAPVQQQERETKKVVSFVMPKVKNLSNLPQPNDPSVTFLSVPAQKVAVIRYSGTWSEKRYQEHWEKLKNELKQKNLQFKESPIFARYNPPWIPWFLRRNEIWVEIN